MGVQLLIDEHSYVLNQSSLDEETLLTRLEGGDKALFATPRINEGQIENAIQVAEDWLMPYTTLLRGETLDVRDVSGRLEVALSAYAKTPTPLWSVSAIEQVFLNMLDQVLRRMPTDVAGVADIILLRELAHHGQVSGVRVHR